MTMNIKQQIEQVVVVINDLRLLHPNEKQIPIHPTEDLPDIPKNKIDLILKRLDKEEWVIDYIQPPSPSSYQIDNPDRWNQCFIVEPLPNFSKYVESLTKPKTAKISFDERATALMCGEIEIPLQYDSKQYDMVKTLFKNPQKKLSKDEIEELYGIGFGEGKREVYDSAKKINKKVEDKTGIPDLIITQKKAIWLNPKHI